MSSKAPAPGGEDGAAQAAVTDILEWLGAPPDPDPAAEIAALGRNLDRLADAHPDSVRLDRILDLFAKRAQSAAAAVEQRAVAESAAEPDRRLLLELAESCGRIARSGARIAGGQGEREPSGVRPSPVLAAARALGCLSRQHRLGLLAGAPAAHGSWREAHRRVREARRELGPDAALLQPSLDVDRTYREMLAMAAAQPAGLSGREILAAADYVARFAATVEVMTSAPAETDRRLFWFDPNRDMAPTAVARRQPPAGREAVFVSCARLGLLAAEQVRELEAGTAAEHLHLPPEAGEAAYRGMLQRLHDAWVEPASRQLARRRHRHPVDVCAGFDAVRRLLALGETSGKDATSTWTMINESPTGFAIRREDGGSAGMLAGGVVALRAGADRAWDVCVVRWVRKDEAGGAEAGLQNLSSGGRPVRLAFRSARAAGSTVDGLLFPPAPAVRAHQAILVPAGSCASRRFLMVTEEEHTHVVQGRMVNLDLQTGLVEMFEFQPDPYPI
ncbi:MAG TPA: hypothetical protein DHV08_14740 [Rhodocyclaceae bacterium]|nr:MAG: hypothetical protein AUK49_08030 [Betaproteobacteria bacterium CG2_30_68_42]PJA57776.1 MAG: hypothetical protein CO164_06125 [Rhodocyclales bacterium CG_4_9_14_3_um_filter_68_10]HCX34673.1 hypothetical protein [Rhodocyclaceae bacterium]